MFPVATLSHIIAQGCNCAEHSRTHLGESNWFTHWLLWQPCLAREKNKHKINVESLKKKASLSDRQMITLHWYCHCIRLAWAKQHSLTEVPTSIKQFSFFLWFLVSRFPLPWWLHKDGWPQLSYSQCAKTKNSVQKQCETKLLFMVFSFLPWPAVMFTAVTIFVFSHPATLLHFSSQTLTLKYFSLKDISLLFFFLGGVVLKGKESKKQKLAVTK